ncbi:MAG: anaerobic carbon-monoxide dehydrogenase iron sulfur subunit [Thermoproteota archaeon]|nr:anaerobic carbon-monoxide dehydrogenase iron sulfur subunit [Thermoproteota archaeon]
MEACLTGAMHVDEKSGNIIHDDKICIGCFTCVMVCPFGAIITDFSGSKTPLKCDLCPSLETPACVANCPNEALVLEEVAE